MSCRPDDDEHQKSLEELLEEQSILLKAILMGIEIIADQEEGTLIEDATSEG